MHVMHVMTPHGSIIVLRVFNLNRITLLSCTLRVSRQLHRLTQKKKKKNQKKKYCRVCSAMFMRDSRGARTPSSSEEAIRKNYEREAQAKDLLIAAPKRRDVDREASPKKGGVASCS
jgi:hypothetical protein